MSRQRKTRHQRPVPQHLRRILYLQNLGILPKAGVSHVQVFHDDECAHFTGRACDCRPEVRPRWTQSVAGRN